jgi:hypothetical protein
LSDQHSPYKGQSSEDLEAKVKELEERLLVHHFAWHKRAEPSTRPKTIARKLGIRIATLMGAAAKFRRAIIDRGGNCIMLRP